MNMTTKEWEEMIDALGEIISIRLRAERAEQHAKDLEEERDRALAQVDRLTAALEHLSIQTGTPAS